jgi:hypothetical protein
VTLVPNLTVQSNISGASAQAVPNSLTAVLDATMSYAAGSMLFRSSSFWQALIAGSTGSLLTIGGGNNPAWLASSTARTTLHSTGASSVPAWDLVDLTSDIRGNLPVANLNSGTNASINTVWRGNGTWGNLPGQGPGRTCTGFMGNEGASATALAADNRRSVACSNDFGTPWTLTSVACWADSNSGTTTIRVLYTAGGSIHTPTTIVCGNQSWVEGTIVGTQVLQPFTSAGTCPVTPCSLDFRPMAVDGVTKYIAVKVTGTLW